MRTEDFYEERLARFVELAEAAQDASVRTNDPGLKITYARLASQWVELAQLARGTIGLARNMADQLYQLEHDAAERHWPR